MSKSQIRYICTNCGYESIKWLGRCPSCDAWNSFTEEIKETKSAKRKTSSENDKSAVKLTNSVEDEEPRIKSGIREFDRVLGGGLTPSSVVLIGGDPGIGKSTLVIQAASKIKTNVLYVTGEESINQIKGRAKRLNLLSDNILVLAETDMEVIQKEIKKHKPSVVIVDSIQTIFDPKLDNAPGTITQIRECASMLMQLAKAEGFSVILVGHVTKEGYIAGPKVLEHMVDTVLQFEGDKNYMYRILRAQKNRFGSTNEIGIFEMHTNGLEEVFNPSKIFLSERNEEATGAVVTTSIEGSRPVLLEVQALVTPSNFGNPQRVATGFDYKKLSILLAVLEKRAGLFLSSQNVFLNMAGGLKIEEPAVDLAVCSAIASSLVEKKVKKGYVVVGEVGLGGEIRGVGQIEKRIQEAVKLGFSNVLLPKTNFNTLRDVDNIKLNPIESVASAIDLLLEQ
jgi:DNA repair protein RadA/Sms